MVHPSPSPPDPTLYYSTMSDPKMGITHAHNSTSLTQQAACHTPAYMHTATSFAARRRRELVRCPPPAQYDFSLEVQWVEDGPPNRLLLLPPRVRGPADAHRTGIMPLATGTAQKPMKDLLESAYKRANSNPDDPDPDLHLIPGEKPKWTSHSERRGSRRAIGQRRCLHMPSSA